MSCSLATALTGEVFLWADFKKEVVFIFCPLGSCFNRYGEQLIGSHSELSELELEDEVVEKSIDYF